MVKLQTQIIRTSPKLTEQQIKELTGQFLTEMTAKIKKLEAENKDWYNENKELNLKNSHLEIANSDLKEKMVSMADQIQEFDLLIGADNSRVKEAEILISIAKSYFQEAANNKPQVADSYRTEFGQRVGLYEIIHGNH